MAINKVPNNYYNDTNIRRDKINTIIDHINELDTHAVVPTPAAGDVGKVVKVGSDGYELASDAGAKLVTATVTADGQGNLSCDKTYAELSASIANGDIVELVYNNQTFVFSGIDYPGIHFVSARNDSNGHNVIIAWTISSANVITFLIEGMNSELPAYSSTDEGKFLGINSNGNLEFSNVPEEINIIEASINPANHNITFGDSITNVCNSILNHEFTFIKAKYHSISYDLIFLFKVDFIDTYDNTIYCHTMQFQLNTCTIYGFNIKPSLTGNSTSYYQKNLAFAT